MRRLWERRVAAASNAEERTMDDLLPEAVRAQIPQLGTVSEQEDPMVWAKLSCEAVGTTWYLIAADWLTTDAIFYGYIVGWDEELTYFNRSDLELQAAEEGVAINYDSTFTPCRLSEVVARERGAGPKFPLGQVVATPGAVEALEQNRQSPTTFLRRHIRGDWGELDEHDQAENEFSLGNSLRLLSAYTLKDRTRIWIITEADRSVTTILLPEEY
jgi:hypothetical protein